MVHGKCRYWFIVGVYRIEKMCISDKPVLKTLALCCRDAVGAICDYQMTTMTSML